MFETQQIHDAPSSTPRRLARSVPRILVAMLFVAIGYTKFPSDPDGEGVRMFELIGLGQWFRYATGIVQITGGVLLLVPRFITPGAVLLGATMVGAAIVDILLLRSPLVIVPLSLLFVVLFTWANAK